MSTISLAVKLSVNNLSIKDQGKLDGAKVINNKSVVIDKTVEMIKKTIPIMR